MPNPSKVVPGANKVIPDPNRVITKVEVTAYSVGQGMGHTIAAYNANNRIIHFAIVDFGSSTSQRREIQDAKNSILNLLIARWEGDWTDNQHHTPIIDAIILSHNDADHKNGLVGENAELKEKIKAKKIYIGALMDLSQGSILTGSGFDNSVYPNANKDAFRWKAEDIRELKQYIPKIYINDGLKYFPINYTSCFSSNGDNKRNFFMEWGAGESRVTFEALSVNCSQEQNAASLVLYCKFLKKGFLFPGDATFQTFTKVIQNVSNHAAAFNDTFFMSIPHHGAIASAIQGPNSVQLVPISITSEAFFSSSLQDFTKKKSLNRNVHRSFVQYMEQNYGDNKDVKKIPKYFTAFNRNKTTKGNNTTVKQVDPLGKRKPEPVPNKLLKNKKQFSVESFSVVVANTELRTYRQFVGLFRSSYAHVSAGACSEYGHPNLLVLNSTKAELKVIDSNQRMNCDGLGLVIYDNISIRIDEDTKPYYQNFGDPVRPSINKRKEQTGEVEDAHNSYCEDPDMATKQKFRALNCRVLNNKNVKINDQQKVLSGSAYTRTFYVGNYNLSHDSQIVSSVYNISNIAASIEYNQINEDIAHGLTRYRTVDWCFRVEKKIEQNNEEIKESIVCSVNPTARHEYPPELIPINELSEPISIYIGEKPTD